MEEISGEEFGINNLKIILIVNLRKSEVTWEKGL